MGQAGQTGETGRLLETVYQELRRIAAGKLAREAPGQTLQATALVHEAWLKLAAEEPGRWSDRGHFLAAAARAMRRILVDRARRCRTTKHGGEWVRVTDPEWDAMPMAASDPDERVLALHEALDRLAAEDPAKAALVEMRYFGGLTIEEAAQVQRISTPTAKRRWAYARAWLFKELQDREPGRQHPRG